MTELSPCLMLLVPADWVAIPEGLTELRRVLGNKYGATLDLRTATAPMSAPVTLYINYWEFWVMREAQENLPQLIERAFYTLNWLEAELEDAG